MVFSSVPDNKHAGQMSPPGTRPVPEEAHQQLRLFLPACERVCVWDFA